MIDNIGSDFNVCLQNVLFGFDKCNGYKIKEYYIINLIILLAKCYIHKPKCNNSKCLFCIKTKKNINEAYID